MVWTKISKNLVKLLTLKRIIILALVIRLLLWPLIYHGDIIVTYWWGKFAQEFTWRGYYDWLNFGGYGRPDQPMLNIYYVWIIRVLFQFMHSVFWFLNINIPLFPSKFMEWFFLNGNQVLLKLPMILADIGIIYFVYFFIKINFNHKKALFSAFLVSTYLPLIYNSAVWGSGDSIINLLGLVSFYFLYKKRFFSFTLLFLFSVLYKSSLLIWAPIALLMFFKQKISISKLVLVIFFAAFLVFIICHPFAINNTFVWFYQTMTLKILPGAMPQITSNAMNFWALIFGLVPQLDNQIVINSLNFRNISLIICFVLYIPVFILLLKNYSFKSVLFTLVNITLITFVFMTRMHERYTFPALIPLLILSFYDKKNWKYFIILSLTHMINVYHWWWWPKIPFLMWFLDLDLIVRLVSFTNVVLLFALLRAQYLSNRTTRQLVP